MELIIITAILTFIVVSLWSKCTYRKGHKNLYVCFEALKNDLNRLSQKLGHKDIYDYWVKTNGRDYAERGVTNIENSLKFLKDS
ncbi:hypothetical protein KAR28_01630 [Candidatus Parcubacteria bacterium]|nr:hypothetical protein [Candidatus Parcubacteria bacterium]